MFLLSQGDVLQHPFVTTEIALGSIKDRVSVIALLGDLPQAGRIGDDLLLDFVTQYGIFGSGLGLVDAHLLGAAVVGNVGKLWTRDKRLAAKADELHCLYVP
ncbi:MAG: hypothetical protein RLZZ58_1465 [Pseudomonadota bacterium]